MPEIVYTTYSEYQKLKKPPVMKVEKSPEEVLDIKFRRAIKKLRQMENQERPRPKRASALNEDERVRLTQRRHYMEKLHRGEISVHSLPRKYFPEYFKVIN